MATYIGFSTFGAKKSFRLTDKELITRDLLNHIHTARGERVMLPGFGTRIPLLTFEPLDQQTLRVVEEDLKAVVQYDPRVELLDLAVMALPDNNAIVALLDIRFIELNATETLRLEFQVNR